MRYKDFFFFRIIFTRKVFYEPINLVYRMVIYAISLAERMLII